MARAFTDPKFSGDPKSTARWNVLQKMVGLVLNLYRSLRSSSLVGPKSNWLLLIAFTIRLCVDGRQGRPHPSGARHLPAMRQLRLLVGEQPE